MKIKLLSTAVALTLATAMAPAFSQQSGWANSDGGERQGMGNAPRTTVADNRFGTHRMDRRSHEYNEPMNRRSGNFSGIDDNHLLNVDQK